MKKDDYYSTNKDGSLCSGYGVFPGGKKCLGCSDCKSKPVSLKQAIRRFNKNHTVISVKAKKRKLPNKPIK